MRKIEIIDDDYEKDLFRKVHGNNIKIGIKSPDDMAYFARKTVQYIKFEYYKDFDEINNGKKTPYEVESDEYNEKKKKFLKK